MNLMITRSIFFTITLLIFTANFSLAQDKGRWIIVSKNSKTITYVDSLKFKDFDTRSYNVGTYKVKAWHPGSMLLDTFIVVRKDSVSILKLKFNELPKYAAYKYDRNKFLLKRWVPKLIIIAAAIQLQLLYKNTKEKTADLENKYIEFKNQYDNAYKSKYITEVKLQQQKTYDKYLKSVRKQNVFSFARLAVPAMIVTTVVIDFRNKRPEPYMEVPLLTFNNSNTGKSSFNFSLLCKF